MSRVYTYSHFCFITKKYNNEHISLKLIKIMIKILTDNDIFLDSRIRMSILSHLLGMYHIYAYVYFMEIFKIIAQTTKSQHCMKT